MQQWGGMAANWFSWRAESLISFLKCESGDDDLNTLRCISAPSYSGCRDSLFFFLSLSADLMSIPWCQSWSTRVLVTTVNVNFIAFYQSTRLTARSFLCLHRWSLYELQARCLHNVWLRADEFSLKQMCDRVQTSAVSSLFPMQHQRFNQPTATGHEVICFSMCC